MHPREQPREGKTSVAIADGSVGGEVGGLKEWGEIPCEGISHPGTGCHN